MAQTPPPPPTVLNKPHHAAPTTRIIPFPAATGKGTAEEAAENPDAGLFTLEHDHRDPVLGTVFRMPNLRWEAVRRFAVSSQLTGFTVIDSSGNKCPLDEIAAAFRLADKEVQNLFFAERWPS